MALDSTQCHHSRCWVESLVALVDGRWSASRSTTYSPLGEPLGAGSRAAAGITVASVSLNGFAETEPLRVPRVPRISMAGSSIQEPAERFANCVRRISMARSSPFCQLSSVRPEG